MLQNSDPYAHYAILTAMLAPAFFLTATASLLLSANNRLARIIDRARTLLKELQDIQGKNQVKAEVKSRINSFLKTGKVNNVYLTDFVVQ